MRGLLVAALVVGAGCGTIPGRAFVPERIAPPTIVARLSVEADPIQASFAPWVRLDYHELPYIHFHGGVGYGFAGPTHGLQGDLVLGHPLFRRRLRVPGWWVDGESVDVRFRRPGWINRAQVPGMQFMSVELGLSLRPYTMIATAAGGGETSEKETVGTPRIGVRWGWCWTVRSGEARGAGCGYVWAHALVWTHGVPDVPEGGALAVAWPDGEDRHSLVTRGAGAEVGFDVPLLLDGALRLRAEGGVLPEPVPAFVSVGLALGFAF